AGRTFLPQMARELEPRVTFDDPLRAFHPIIPVHFKIRKLCQILGISICFFQLGYPRFIGYDLLFWVGLHFSDPPRRLGWQCALESIDERCATIACASKTCLSKVPSLLSRMTSGVASLQRLWLALTRAIPVATKA